MTFLGIQIEELSNFCSIRIVIFQQFSWILVHISGWYTIYMRPWRKINSSLSQAQPQKINIMHWSVAKICINFDAILDVSIAYKVSIVWWHLQKPIQLCITWSLEMYWIKAACLFNSAEAIPIPK